ncbi:MAG: hypothetical protein JRH18_06480 [Deltaproteobacteria bacterium]|nr:hypothetical protein [Deltaproteobacteria bacterium]MBW2151299.1 hypothetical protein [Deltaproteobacteria bacterium]
MIKTNLYSWQIILIHMQEDLAVMKEKFLVVEDGLDADDQFLQLVNKIESDIEELYKYLQQQTVSSDKVRAEEDYQHLLDNIPL